MSDDLIEAVAKAIFKARYENDKYRLNPGTTWDEIAADAQDAYREQARAAISVIETP